MAPTLCFARDSLAVLALLSTLACRVLLTDFLGDRGSISRDWERVARAGCLRGESVTDDFFAILALASDGVVVRVSYAI